MYCTCACMYMDTHVGVHACNGSRLMSRLIFDSSSTSLIETGSLNQTQRLWVCLGWDPLSLSSKAGITVCGVSALVDGVNLG